jgi:hypothetical protein
VDTGLNRLYSLYQEDGEPQAMVCGGSASAQWESPGDLATDTQGAIIVSDTGNHRLLLLSSDWQLAASLEVDRALSSPVSVCLDNRARQVVVHNTGSKELVKYAVVNV